NRNGLVARARLTHAYGNAETHAALQMLASLAGSHEVTCGADKGFDNRQFESESRNLKTKAHVARKRVRSAIPAARARQVGYGISQRKRKRIEEVFGWMKTIALLRETRYRGRERVEWAFTFAAAAYNLVRMRKLLAQPA
ncbi:MAG TPA: transposase, partial [Terriglobales bacterium]|nr:transposase [Terriglobales bacterium]